jgi:hypothetical protein
MNARDEFVKVMMAQRVASRMASDKDEKKEDEDEKSDKPFPGAAPPFGKEAADDGDETTNLLERALTHAEKQVEIMRHAFDLYKRDARKYQPQLKNFEYAANQLRSVMRITDRALAGKTASSPLNERDAFVRMLLAMEHDTRGNGKVPQRASGCG